MLLRILTVQFMFIPGKQAQQVPETEELLELGKPRLGEVTKITVHIKESYEFKVITLFDCLLNILQHNMKYLSGTVQ